MKLVSIFKRMVSNSQSVKLDTILKHTLLGSKNGLCQYLPPADNVNKWNEFRDHALVKF